MRCLTILLGNCFLLLVSLASCGKVSLAEEAVFSIPVDTTFMRLRQWEWYCQKRADSCLTENNYQGALSWLDSARIQVEHYGRPYYILARGDVYYSIHQYDSARRYFSMAAHSIHPHIAIEAWRKLAELELMEGNEKQVFYSTQKADALFRVEIGHVQSDNSEALYQEERLKNELNQLKIAKQNREIAMLTLSLCLIILIALFIFYRQNKIKREKERLLLLGQPLEYFFHVVDKAHIQHPVGFVQDKNFQMIGGDQPLVVEINEPARGLDPRRRK